MLIQEVDMSFDDLPDLPRPIVPAGRAWVERISAAARDALASHPCTTDIPYGHESYWQKLDIFFPRQAAARLPVFCFLHGGAWFTGCKEWLAGMAPSITAAPALFVAASHRRVPDNRFPDPIDDIIDLIAWLYRHVGDFGGDPDNIQIGGHSAGAHLAALATLRTDLLLSHGLPADVIKACHPVSGIFDLRAQLPHSLGDTHSREGRHIVDWLLPTRDLASAASPIEQIAGQTPPPFHVVWGGSDLPDLEAQSLAFIATLQAAGGQIVSARFADHDHFMMSEACADPSGSWVRQVHSWLRDAGPAGIRESV